MAHYATSDTAGCQAIFSNWGEDLQIYVCYMCTLSAEGLAGLLRKPLEANMRARKENPQGGEHPETIRQNGSQGCEAKVHPEQ